MSTDTAAELIPAVAYPKSRLSVEEQQELLADYRPWCVTVRMPAKLPATRACRDPFGAPFLQPALAGKARWLVTGDRDLLALSGDFSCPIISPDELLSALGQA